MSLLGDGFDAYVSMIDCCCRLMDKMPILTNDEMMMHRRCGCLLQLLGLLLYATSSFFVWKEVEEDEDGWVSDGSRQKQRNLQGTSLPTHWTRCIVLIQGLFLQLFIYISRNFIARDMRDKVEVGQQ